MDLAIGGSEKHLVLTPNLGCIEWTRDFSDTALAELRVGATNITWEAAGGTEKKE